MRFPKQTALIFMCLLCANLPLYPAEIHDAAASGDISVVKSLLAADQNLLNAQDDRGMTVLHSAAYNNHPEIVEFLIAEGANLDARSSSGSTPLHGAAYYGFVEVASILIEKGCNPNVVNNGGYSPVSSAIAGDQAEIVEFLLNKGVDPNQRNNQSRTLLHQAVMSGKSNLVALLVKNGADLDARTNFDESPLWWALRFGNNEIATQLIEAAAPIESRMGDGTTMLHHATLCNNAEIVNRLIQNGLDVNSTQRFGLTPLHMAAIFGYGEIMEILLRNGADENCRSMDGGLPLFYVLESGNETFAELFQNNKTYLPRNFPDLHGKYLGQPEPGKTPAKFAPPVLLSPSRPHGGLTVSPDGKEIYWTRNSFATDMYEKIWYTREVDGRWTPPVIASFSDEYRNSHPCFAPDGSRIYYNSNRPRTSGGEPEPDEDIWYVERTESGWSNPINPGAPLNTEGDDFLPSVSENGNLFFIRISINESGGRSIDVYQSSLTDGQFSDPQNIGEPVNSIYVEARPLIAPDESYIIFTSNRPGGLQEDLESYISFHKLDGSWSQPVPIGTEKTMQGISADGQFWFYADYENGMMDYYWVSSSVAEDFRR